MRIDELLIKKGAEVMIGAPANPLNPEATAAVASAVSSTPGVLEAHLPQVFIPGVSENPAQVLILVLSGSTPVAQVMSQLGPSLHRIIPGGVYLDVWPLPRSHQLLPTIRNAGCQIWQVPKRPWWRFW
jgi:hypothetical protein